MEFTVAGKKVVLRERIPLGEGYDLVGLFTNFDANDLRTNIPIMTRLVESWEFEGDPSDSAAYDDLDTLTEFLPIAKRVNARISVLMSDVADEDEAPEKN